MAISPMACPRLSREAERPLRFYVSGNPFVSGPKTLNR